MALITVSDSGCRPTQGEQQQSERLFKFQKKKKEREGEGGVVAGNQYLSMTVSLVFVWLPLLHWLRHSAD